jgi:hypothetical protein
MLAIAPTFPAPPPPEASLLAQLEDLRERHGTLALVAHLAELEDREAIAARRRQEPGAAGLASLLAQGLRAFGPQLEQAAKQRGIEFGRPGRDDVDRQAWSGHRGRVRGTR